MILDKKPAKSVVVFLLGFLCLAMLTGAALFTREVNRGAKTIADLLGTDLIIIPKAAEDFGFQFVVSDVNKPLYLPSAVLESLRNEPEIERLTYHIHLGKPPDDCCTYIDGPIIAFDEVNDFIIKPLIAEQRKRGPLANNEILEGGSIYDYLGLVTDIVLFNNSTKIVGHLKHTDTNFDNCVFMRVENIETVSSEYLPDFSPDSVSVIFIQLNAAVKVEEFAARIQMSYPNIVTISKGSFFQAVKNLF